MNDNHKLYPKIIDDPSEIHKQPLTKDLEVQKTSAYLAKPSDPKVEPSELNFYQLEGAFQVISTILGAHYGIPCI